MARMSSPVAGYVTSEYGMRNGTLHAGIDIATGGKSGPVHATFAGTVEKIVRGRAHGDRSRSNEIAPYRTGNGVIVRNPDGERQVYVHTLALSSLRVGDKVQVGTVIGNTDLSGNTTGYHCHYEEWTASGATRNPRASFRAFKVTPGQTPVKAPKPPKKSPGGANPHTTRYPDVPLDGNPTHNNLFYALDLVVRGAGVDGGHKTRAKRIQHWLLGLGYLKTPSGKPGLVDGKWGPQSWKALQLRLRECKRKPYTGPIDGIAPRSSKTGTTWHCAAAFCNDRRATARRA